MEPIGNVELQHAGDLVRVGVYAGEVHVRLSTSDYREQRAGVYLNPDEVRQLCELLAKAEKCAPVVQSAVDECRQIVMTAEADYELTVANLIGGA